MALVASMVPAAAAAGVTVEAVTRAVAVTAHSLIFLQVGIIL